MRFLTFLGKRFYCTARTRNIGILAHIDAGKTTTTERMLFYSGEIDHMGEVHHGNTVTDFMDQERERGITIQSAAVSFMWKKYQINLIDTPGHIDFTQEVEQSLGVIDGIIVVLDGTAGVEAQTVTVWSQANRYQIPRIVFVNKMDRPQADYEQSCRSIEQKFNIPTLPLQKPVRDQKGQLYGFVDLINLDLVTYKNTKQSCRSLRSDTDYEDRLIWEQAKLARAHLIDLLTNYNDHMANLVIELESLDNIDAKDLIRAVKETTLQQKAVPVLMGSAYKNIAVQPLMDAVLLYLPTPQDRNQVLLDYFQTNLCGKTFKVRHDIHKGPLVFLRLYNGVLNRNQKVYSAQQNTTEQIKRLYLVFADDLKEVDEITAGNIAVLGGLKSISSGELITNGKSTVDQIKERILHDKRSADQLLGVNRKEQEPVFFRSIEPPNLALQKDLERALQELQREDTSFRVEEDEEAQQKIVSGMGELHLEIMRERILREYGIEADMGPLQIAYRETPLTPLRDTFKMESRISNVIHSFEIEMSLTPDIETYNMVMKNPPLVFDKSAQATCTFSGIHPKYLEAIALGANYGLAQGPKIGGRLVGLTVGIHNFHVSKGTSETIVSAGVTKFLKNLLKTVGTNILEPVMLLEVALDPKYSSAALNDLGQRRADIRNISPRGNITIISANVPLAELVGYSTVIRVLSSGTANFTMEFDSYKVMTCNEEDRAIKNVRGF